MKKIVIFVGLIAAWFFSSVCLAEMKIGIIDVNKVLANVKQVKDMQASLQKQFNPRGREIINMQNIFRGNLEKYRQNNVKLKGNVLKQEQQKLFSENRKLQETQVNFQRDLVAAQNRALRPILQQIEKIADKVSKAQKYDLVVTKISTVYSNSKFEITDQVIAEMAKISSTNVVKVNTKNAPVKKNK